MLAAHIAGSRHSLRPPLRMQFNTDNSLNSVGFLSPEMEPIIADLRKIHATWFVFAEDVNRTGQRILREFQPSGTVTVRDVVGIALLMRTLSNFQGTILMAQRGMAAEAGTLARCCFENAFFLGTLRKEEDDFLAEMQMADRYGVKAAARWLVRIPDRLEHAPRRAKQRLEGLINEIKQQIPGFEPSSRRWQIGLVSLMLTCTTLLFRGKPLTRPRNRWIDISSVGAVQRPSRKCVGAPMPATLTKSG
jgi:hypothetical protein